MQTVTSVMTTTTTTTTTTAAEQPPSLARNHFVNRARVLRAIIDRFKKPEEEEQKGRQSGVRSPQGQDEILSDNLHAWARKFLEDMRRVVDPSSISNVERVREIVKPYFESLDEVLQDPLLSAAPNSTPEIMRKPVVDREVWDEDVHALCYKLCGGISPIDGKPMSEHPPVHSFGRAIIDWRATLFPEASGTHIPPAIGTVVVSRPSVGDQNLQREGFISLGLLLRTRRILENCLRQRSHTRHLVAVKQEENRVVLAEGQARADLHEARLAEELERLEKSQAEHLQQLNSKIDAQEAWYHNSIEQLKKNLEAAEKSNQATAVLLRAQLATLLEEQQRTRDALAAEIHAVKQLQEQKVRELKAEQALIESQHQLQVTQMQNTHSQTVVYLKGDISNLSGRVQQTEQALSTAQQVNRQQQQKVQNLEQQTINLSRQVEQERRRADEADDGFCSLM